MSALGDLIKQYLDVHDVESKELAAAAGLTPQSISGYTSGKPMKTYPEHRNMKALADAMGVPYVVVLTAVATDLGEQLTEDEVDPALQVTIAALKSLPPERASVAATVVASLTQQTLGRRT